MDAFQVRETRWALARMSLSARKRMMFSSSSGTLKTLADITDGMSGDAGEPPPLPSALEAMLQLWTGEWC